MERTARRWGRNSGAAALARGRVGTPETGELEANYREYDLEKTDNGGCMTNRRSNFFKRSKNQTQWLHTPAKTHLADLYNVCMRAASWNGRRACGVANLAPLPH